MVRALVGLASIAVIAFVGYFFWGEYQKADEARRLATLQQERDNCLMFLDRYAGGKADEKGLVDDCANRLLITAEDIKAAGRR